MDSVLRGAAVYLFLLVIFRLTGKRSLDQVTTFDFVLLLIISETTQQALLGEDFSITNCFLLVLTLFALDQGFSYLKERSRTVARLMEGLPLVLFENGKPHEDRMDKEAVDAKDILEAARGQQGLERLDQIKHAVLERHGGISIIPKQEEAKG